MIALAAALVLDAVFGWPDALYRRIGHPVSWMGTMISALEVRLNRAADPAGQKQVLGALTALSVVCASSALAGLVALLLPGGALGVVLTALVAAPFLAANSLYIHVRAVARPLAAGDLEGARQAVSMIVGRNPEALDRPAIARATIESMAENTSDGVIAPLFWGALLGLPGLVGYKAINTLDSMIGYRTERYMDFGKFAARLDDVANWIPARLTGLMIALVSSRLRASIEVMLRDAPQHRSPNAGWPEAAMAAALNCRLSGPRIYATGAEDAPWLNAAAPDPDVASIRSALGLFVRTVGVAGVGLLVLGIVSG